MTNERGWTMPDPEQALIVAAHLERYVLPSFSGAHPFRSFLDNEGPMLVSSRGVPWHNIVSLNRGEGRTSFLEFGANLYLDWGVIDCSGRDPILEVSLPEELTVSSIKKVFHMIRSAADYANEYHGVCGIDITSLLNNYDEFLLEAFVLEARQCMKHAWFNFFLDEEMKNNTIGFSRNDNGTHIEGLIERLKHELERVQYTGRAYYDTEALASILSGMLVKWKIESREKMLSGDPSLHSLLCEVVTRTEMTTVKDVGRIGMKIIKECTICHGEDREARLLLDEDLLIDLFELRTARRTAMKEKARKR